MVVKTRNFFFYREGPRIFKIIDYFSPFIYLFYAGGERDIRVLFGACRKRQQARIGGRHGESRGARSADILPRPLGGDFLISSRLPWH